MPDYVRNRLVDRAGATRIVAASDSKETNRADFQCDGTNDDVEIQAAIDALPATGGRVLLLDGTYNLQAHNRGGVPPTYCIRITSDDVWIEGQGTDTILKLADMNSQDAIAMILFDSVSRVSISNLQIDGDWQTIDPGGTTEFEGVWLLGCTQVCVDKCYIHHTSAHYIAIYSSSDVVVQGCSFESTAGHPKTNHGIDVDNTGSGAAASTDVVIANNFISNVTDAASKTENAHRVNYVGNVFEAYVSVDESPSDQGTEHIQFIGNVFNTGISTIYRRTGPVSLIGNTFHDARLLVAYSGGDVIIADNIFDGSADNTAGAIQLNNTIDNITVSGNMIVSALERGIGASGTSGIVVIRGNHIIDAADWGIFASGLPKVVIEGNFCDACQGGIRLAYSSDYAHVVSNVVRNSTPYPNYHGIFLDNVDECEIISNRLYDDQGSPTQQYGIRLGEGSTNNRVINNYASGNVNAQISDGGTGTVLRHNKGLVTENSGTATLVNGNTSIAVNHGLGVTPAAGDIMVTPIESLGNATEFYIDTYTSTQFTIHVDADPGADVDFAWQAQVL